MIESSINHAYALPHPFCIEVEGADASRVVNNLCTNDVARLPVGGSCEAFVTNLRGWVVAHAMIAKYEKRMVLVGQHPEPQSICNHIDRYIIREDARVSNLSAERSLLVAVERNPKQQAGGLPARLQSQLPLAGSDSQTQLCWIETQTQTVEPTPAIWCFLWCNNQFEPKLWELLLSHGYSMGTFLEFERERIASFWPLQGQEILEKSLPQELDRDSSAISFTKGCYLGQETIARLDARGQLQKKLCLLEVLDGPTPEISSPIFDGEREIGSLSSVAAHPSHNALGLATLKRGAFEVGKRLACMGAPLQVLPTC